MIAGLSVLVVLALRRLLFWGGSLHALIDSAEALAFLAVMFTIWRSGICAAQDAKAQGLVRMSWPVFAVALLVPPYTSLDATQYLARGRVLAIHGENPFNVAPLQIRDDPVLLIMDRNWAFQAHAYGPLPAEVQGAVAWAAAWFEGAGSYACVSVGILLLKIVSLAALIVLAKCARGIASRVGAPDAAGVELLVLWNPWLLLKGPICGHNDLWCAALIAVTVVLLLDSRMGFATLAWFAAVATKYVPLVLGPLVVACAVRAPARAWRGFWAAALIVLVLGGIWYLRFLDEPGAFRPLMAQARCIAASFVWLFGEDDISPARAGLQRSLQVALTMGLCAQAIMYCHGGSVVRLPAMAAWALIGTVLLGLTYVVPTYHCWWLALALGSTSPYLVRAAIWTSLCSAVSYLPMLALRDYGAVHQSALLFVGLLLPLVLACFKAADPKRLCWSGGARTSPSPHAPEPSPLLS